MAYASVNGLQLYYEIRGSGRPLVLLHGGLLTIDLNFGPLLGPLEASRQVIAVELQGHGHTADRDFTPLPHVVEMFELLPDAQLAVLPGTTHVGVTRRPGEVLALITPFLDAR
jgi:pimeloyl-ACP methyl ester carboxylesterase